MWMSNSQVNYSYWKNEGKKTTLKMIRLLRKQEKEQESQETDFLKKNNKANNRHKKIANKKDEQQK